MSFNRQLSYTFLICAVLCFRLSAQHPDSTQINGTWYYIYPIEKELTLTYGYVANNRFSTKQLKLYLQWVEQKDPRVLAPYRSVKKDIRKEARKLPGKEEKKSRYTYRKFSRSVRRMLDFERRRRKKIEQQVYRDSLELQIDSYYPFSYDIIPVSYTLPDGNYVQYYVPFSPVDRRGRVQPAAQHPALFFELKSNELVNEATFLGWFGDTIKHGRFENGLRTGEWSYLRQSDFELERNNTVTYINKNYTAGFKQGKLDGAYHFYHYDKPCLSGTFRENEPVGTWEEIPYGRDKDPYYHMVDSLIRFGVPEKNTVLPYDSIVLLRGYEVRLTEDNHDYGTFYMSFLRTVDREKVLADTLPTQLPVSSLIESPLMQLNAHSSSAMVPVHKFTFSGTKEAFYANGQLIYRTTIVPGKRYIEPVIYWNNGRVYDSISFNETTLEYTRLNYSHTSELIHTRIYDRKGKMTYEDYPGKEKEVPLIIEGHLVEEIMGRFIYKIETPGENGDTLFITRQFQSSDTILTKEFSHSSDKKRRSSTYFNYYGTPFVNYTFEQDAHQLVTNTSKLKLGTLEIDGRSQYVQQEIDYTVSSLFLAESGQVDSSLILLKWDEQPYTGEVTITFGNDYRITRGEKLAISYPSSVNGKQIRKQCAKLKAKGNSYHHPLLELAIEKPYSERDPFKLAIRQLLAINNLENMLAEKDKPAPVIYSGRMKNGRPDGEWQFFDKNQKCIYSIGYTDGKMNGNIVAWSRTTPAVRGLSKLPLDEIYDTDYRVPSKRMYYKSGTYDYANGSRSGIHIDYNWEGDTVSYQQFVNDEMDGYFLLKDLFYRSEGTMVNGKLNGLYYYKTFTYSRDTTATADKNDFLRSETPLFTLQLKNGRLDGACAVYNPNNDRLRALAHFTNGEMTDTFRYYSHIGEQQMSGLFTDSVMTGMQFFRDGWLDYTMRAPKGEKLVIDQLFEEYQLSGITALLRKRAFEHTFRSMEFSEAYDMNDDPAILNKELHFTKYFPNGNSARTGTLFSEKKTGLWSFFDYDGKLLYTINYADSAIRINDTVKLLSKGIYNEYDSAGKIISRRYVIEEDEKYDCTHSDYYAIRQYATFEAAPDSPDRMNGHVRNYFDNGALQSEGMLVNGLPTGLWKIYSPDGKLYMAGNYILGKRNGRWLTGDLSGQKYLGEICLDHDTPEIEELIRKLQNDLDIKLTYYKMGVQQTTNLYNWDKNASNVELHYGTKAQLSGGMPNF